MKIEKLTENKIRVITDVSDLNTDEFDIANVFSNLLNNKEFFSSILDMADKQFGFNTDGCKLIIEAISYLENIFVFTVTKYSLNTNNLKPSVNKPFENKPSNFIYKFDTFEDFCLFCEHIYNISNFEIKKFSKNISLYYYNDTYFLFAKNVNSAYKFAKAFDCVAIEFATKVSCTSSCESLLLEYGKVVIKNNAVLTGFKYFASKQR